MPATAPWLASAEALLNRNIAASSDAMALAHRLDGTRLEVEALGLMSIQAAVHDGRMSLLATPDIAAPGAEARITGSAMALLKMLRGARSVGTASANDRSSVQVSGDAEIANLYRELFMAARPELEEELSRFIGDLPARQVSQWAAGLRNWMGRTRRAAAENITEYLQEEGRDLVNHTEFDEYLHGVDRVRETTDRIEARLARLEQIIQGGG